MCGAAPAGGLGTLSGYAQVKLPAAPPWLHVPDGETGAAVKSPFVPEPAVSAANTIVWAPFTAGEAPGVADRIEAELLGAAKFTVAVTVFAAPSFVEASGVCF